MDTGVFLTITAVFIPVNEVRQWDLLFFSLFFTLLYLWPLSVLVPQTIKQHVLNLSAFSGLPDFVQVLLRFNPADALVFEIKRFNQVRSLFIIFSVQWIIEGPEVEYGHDDKKPDKDFERDTFMKEFSEHLPLFTFCRREIANFCWLRHLFFFFLCFAY